MPKFLSCLAALLLSSCAGMQLPQTRHDFRAYSKAHDGIQQLTVASSLAQVVGRLKTHTEKCNSFGKSFTRTEGMGGNPAPMKVTSESFPKWEHVTGTTATMVIIKKDHQIINEPKEGQLWFILDLKSSGAGTVATLYDLNGPKWATYDYVTEFTAAMQGKPGPCQIEAIQ